MKSPLVFFGIATALAGPVLADNWPQWRGPSFNGVAETEAPLEWSDSKNVKWKLDLPGRAFSTPVIWGDRLFLTNAVAASAPSTPSGGGRGPGGGAGAGVAHRLSVMAINRNTGKPVWEQTARTVTPPEGYHQKYGSFASYAPLTDGKYLWALFGSFGLYCYDLNGKLIWKKELPLMHMRNQFGEGGAPALAGDRLIVSLDQESGAFIMALDKTTGKELWRQERDEISAWSTPLIVKSGKKTVAVVSATKKVRAYDVENGNVVWECGGLGVNVIPAPVLFEDLVIVMSGFRDPNLLAIRLGREGDLTGTDAVVWTNQRGNSYTASPVLAGGKLYFVTDNGMLSCFNPRTGEAYYRQQRFPQPYNFKASPVAAGPYLYLASEEGDTIVVKLGETFEVAATNTLTDQFFVASPVVVDRTIYLRSSTALFCIKN